MIPWPKMNKMLSKFKFEINFRLKKRQEDSDTENKNYNLFGDDCQKRNAFDKKKLEDMTDVEQLWFGKSMPFLNIENFDNDVQDEIRSFYFDAKSICRESFSFDLSI